MMIRVFIAGNPATQGSKRFVGGGRFIESCKRLPAWREDVRAGLLGYDGQPRLKLGERPARIDVIYILPRPKSLPKKKDICHTKKPDIDKLTRAICDAITSAGVWNDDSQCCEQYCTKRYSTLGETPGCWIEIRESEYV